MEINVRELIWLCAGILMVALDFQNNLPLIAWVPFDIRVHVGVHHHHHDDVCQPVQPHNDLR